MQKLESLSSALRTLEVLADVQVSMLRFGHMSGIAMLIPERDQAMGALLDENRLGSVPRLQVLVQATVMSSVRSERQRTWGWSFDDPGSKSFRAHERKPP